MSIEQAEAAGNLILLVEDNEVNREVLQLQLSVLGYTSVQANDGKQALDYLKKYDIALILTDCHMPGMDGYELSREVRRIEQDSNKSDAMPIIAITANTMQDEWRRCEESGMNAFISKPLELELLQDELLKWLPSV